MLCRILLGTNLQLNHERSIDIGCANACLTFAVWKAKHC